MASNQPSRDPSLGIRAGAVLGLLAHIMGIKQAELARRISRAHVRAYIHGRRDVSELAAERIWQAFARRALFLGDENATVARCLGKMLHARACLYESLSSNIVAVAAPIPDCEEARLPWLWFGAIELAFLCAMTAENGDDEACPSHDLAIPFSDWLRSESTHYGVSASASALAARLHELREDPRHERARRRFQRYFSGALPVEVEDQIELVHALAGTRSVTPEARRIGVRVARAIHASRILQCLTDFAPDYAQAIAQQWNELYKALLSWARAREPDVRMALAFSGTFGGARGEALKEVAPLIGDRVFRRFVLAYAEGMQAAIDHMSGAYAWLRSTWTRYGEPSRAAQVHYESLANLTPTELMGGYAAAVAEGAPAILPREYVAGFSALERGQFREAVVALSRIVGQGGSPPGTSLLIAGAQLALGDRAAASAALDEFLAKEHASLDAVVRPVLILLASVGRSRREFLEGVCARARREGRIAPHAALIILAHERFLAGDAVAALDAYIEYMVGKTGGSSWSATDIAEHAIRTLPSWSVGHAVEAAHVAAKTTEGSFRRYENIAALLRRLVSAGS